MKGPAVLVISFAALTVSCGARSDLPSMRVEDDAGVTTSCEVDEDCPGIEDLCHPVHCTLPEGGLRAPSRSLLQRRRPVHRRSL